jgi:hypothetical protein
LEFPVEKLFSLRYVGYWISDSSGRILDFGQFRKAAG